MSTYRAYITPDVNGMYPWFQQDPNNPTNWQSASFDPTVDGTVNPAPQGMLYGPGGAPLIFGSTPGQWVDSFDQSSWFPWLMGGIAGFLIAKLLD